MKIIIYFIQDSTRSENLIQQNNAALKLIEIVLISMDAGETPVGIFIDLNEAFDTLDHTILIQKLNHYVPADSSSTLL